jgi:rhamnosyltransferase
MKTFYHRRALLAITAGTLISVDRFNQIGLFNESYFIDFVDNDYCLRAAMLGLTVAVNCKVVLNHAIGRREEKSFLGLSIKPNHHAPNRRYYIARNGVFTAIKYFYSYPSYALLIAIRLAHEFLSILLYESNRRKKAVAMIGGIKHGFHGKMGSCSMSHD